MDRYAYNQQMTPPSPFVHVTVRPPIEGPAGVVVPAQIDTGADLSVIPGRLVDELQLIPLDSLSALGFGGHLITLPTFLVEIETCSIDSHSCWTVRIWSSR